MVWVLASCSGGDSNGTDELSQTGNPSGATGTEPSIPSFDAGCSEIKAAIDYFGEEHVFRAQVDAMLVDDAPQRIVRTGMLANRDLWSLCAFDVPQFVEDLVPESTGDVDPQVLAFRVSMEAADVHTFDDASDGGIEVLGGFICNVLEPQQPVSTAEILSLADELIERYGRMTELEAGEVVLFTVSSYCPDFDLSGGTF